MTDQNILSGNVQGPYRYNSNGETMYITCLGEPGVVPVEMNQNNLVARQLTNISTSNPGRYTCSVLKVSGSQDGSLEEGELLEEESQVAEVTAEAAVAQQDSDDSASDLFSLDSCGLDDESADMMDECVNDEFTAQLASSGPVGAAAAAAISTARRRNKSLTFEINPTKRRRQQTRLLRKMKSLLEEYTARVGQQAAVLCCTPASKSHSPLAFRVFGSKPLEAAIRDHRGSIMSDLEAVLTDHSSPGVKASVTTTPNSSVTYTTHQHLIPAGSGGFGCDLPALNVDGIPTPVDKMTQAQLRMFIPEMLKYSTGRSKPGWGKEECCPEWWPEGVPWANVRSDIRSDELKKQYPWTEILREIIISCYQYHGREDLLPGYSSTPSNAHSFHGNHLTLSNAHGSHGNLSLSNPHSSHGSLPINNIHSSHGNISISNIHGSHGNLSISNVHSSHGNLTLSNAHSSHGNLSLSNGEDFLLSHEERLGEESIENHHNNFNRNITEKSPLNSPRITDISGRTVRSLLETRQVVYSSSPQFNKTHDTTRETVSSLPAVPRKHIILTSTVRNNRAPLGKIQPDPCIIPKQPSLSDSNNKQTAEYKSPPTVANLLRILRTQQGRDSPDLHILSNALSDDSNSSTNHSRAFNEMAVADCIEELLQDNCGAADVMSLEFHDIKKECESVQVDNMDCDLLSSASALCSVQTIGPAVVTEPVYTSDDSTVKPTALCL